MLSWTATIHASDTCPKHCRKLQIQLQIELGQAVVVLVGVPEFEVRAESDTLKNLLVLMCFFVWNVCVNHSQELTPILKFRTCSDFKHTWACAFVHGWFLHVWILSCADDDLCFFIPTFLPVIFDTAFLHVPDTPLKISFKTMNIFTTCLAEQL